MSNELIIAKKEDLVSIADVVREALGTTETMSFDNLIAGINEAIEGGVVIETGTISSASDVTSLTVPLSNRNPDIFVAVATPETSVTGTRQDLICDLAIKEQESISEDGSAYYMVYSFLYATGTRQQYSPYVKRHWKSNISLIHLNFIPLYNSSAIKAGVEYSYIAIWGATI